MVVYSFIHSFREGNFYGAPSCVSERLWCAAGEESTAEHRCGALLALRSLSVRHCLHSS
jgi:hypothetical protein